MSERYNNDVHWTSYGDWQRVASFVVAVAYLFIAPFLFPSRSWSHLMAAMIIRILSLAAPVACIWFAEDLAEYYDSNPFRKYSASTAARLIRLGGWMLLLLPILLFLFQRWLVYLYVR